MDKGVAKHRKLSRQASSGGFHKDATASPAHNARRAVDNQLFKLKSPGKHG